KKRYFYGLKIHLMVTQEGQPVECFLTPGSFGDVDALKYYAYELPDGSIIYADKAYNDYEIEDLLKEVDHIQLIPMRKKNSKRALPPSISFVQSYHRKRVETAGSLIAQLLPKSIQAVTSQGFELKVALFVIASSLNGYLNLYAPCREQLRLAIKRKVPWDRTRDGVVNQLHTQCRVVFERLRSTGITLLKAAPLDGRVRPRGTPIVRDHIIMGNDVALVRMIPAPAHILDQF